MVLGLAKPWPRLWSGSWSTHKELVTIVSCGWNTSVVHGIFVSTMIPQDLRASGRERSELQSPARYLSPASTVSKVW